MFEDERISYGAGKTYRNMLFISGAIALINLIIILFTVRNDTLNRLWFEISVLGSVLILFAIAFICKFDFKNERKTVFQTTKYFKNAVRITVIVGLLGLSASLATISKDTTVNPNVLLIIFVSTLTIYATYSFKSKNVYMNYAFIHERFGKYLSIVFFKLCIVLGSLTIFYLLFSLINYLSCNIAITPDYLLGAYCVLLIEFCSFYLLYSIYEKLEYDDCNCGKRTITANTIFLIITLFLLAFGFIIYCVEQIMIPSITDEEMITSVSTMVHFIYYIFCYYMCIIISYSAAVCNSKSKLLAISLDTLLIVSVFINGLAYYACEAAYYIGLKDGLSDLVVFNTYLEYTTFSIVMLIGLATIWIATCLYRIRRFNLVSYVSMAATCGVMLVAFILILANIKYSWVMIVYFLSSVVLQTIFVCCYINSLKNIEKEAVKL